MTDFNFNVNSYELHELKSIYNEACTKKGMNFFSTYNEQDILSCKPTLYNALIKKNPVRLDEATLFIDQSSQLLINELRQHNETSLGAIYTKPIEKDFLNPTMKNINQRIVIIDSQYRENIVPYYPNNPSSTTSATDFLVNFSDSLNDVTSMQLYSIQIPYTWYVIDETHGNHYFYIEISDVSYKISLDSGNYTETQFITHINSVIATAISSSDVTVSWNENNGIFSIINSSSDDITVVFFDYDDARFKSTEANKESPKNNYNLGWFLGYRTISNNIMAYDISAGDTLKGEAVMDINGPKYFMLLIDDFNQNHLNRGLVNIDMDKQFIELPKYTNAPGTVSCDPCNATGMTKSQIYTYQSIAEYRNTFGEDRNSRMNSGTTTNIMAIIPLDVSFLSIGKVFTETSSSLEANSRIYFGPVNIDKMKIRLIDDRGKNVNLHGNDWCFGLTTNHLYKY